MFSNGPRTVVTGLSLLVDAADPLSYPGSGTSWTDIVTGITGSLSGSITYASDFKGTLVVNNSSSVIIFPTSSGNFGTDSFTVELAFQPNQINGQHWLVAKNSGSFPSWGAFITGSSGSGRITAFFNVSSTISCSMSTPTGSIVTGSNYLVDINFFPNTTSNTIYLNSELSGSNIPNGGGSLTATSSLFISNRNSGSSVGTPLEIFNTKLYTPRLVAGMIRQNYNSLSTRLGLSQKISLPIIEEKLLNFYPDAAAAYSLRLLNNTYGGAAIQVRRSSDNTVLDIGFISNGDLDTSTLLAHCGSGDGFVTTWYDQSGNGRNASQPTAGNQPQIVSNGFILSNAGKPCLQFYRTGDSLKTNLTILRPYSIFAQFLQRSNSSLTRMLASDTTNSLIASSRLTNTVYTESDVVSNNYASNDQNVIISLIQSATSTTKFFYNTNNIANISPASSNWGLFCFGNSSIPEGAQGQIKETIIWSSDQSSNNSEIQTNMNSYYGIY
jgi:hypothetical protein